MVGLYKYDATTEEELSFEEGDKLTLYEQDDPDWFLVGNGTHVGFVPGNYIEVTRIYGTLLQLRTVCVRLFLTPTLSLFFLIARIFTWFTRPLQDRADKHRQSNHKSNMRKNTQLSRITIIMNRSRLSQ